MLGKSSGTKAQAGEAVSKKEGLDGTPGRVGAGLCLKGVAPRKPVEPGHAHACCCYGSEFCAGVSSVSPAASPAARRPGA